MRIKDIPQEERPRERLIKYGSRALSNAELLAIILRSGSQKNNVLELSQKLLQQNNIKSLSRKRVSTLINNLGIGEAKACQISAAFELGKRLAAHSDGRAKTINTAKDIAKLLMPEMSALKKEHLKVVLLDSRRKVIKAETIFIGTVNESVIHPREIFQAALEESATALILVHNHPSGDPTPSEEDVKVTKQLVNAGELLGIQVLDHIIIGKTYLSFKEKGYC